MTSDLMVRRLRDYLVRTPPPHVPTVMPLLPYTRQALESTDSQGEFPVLNLFCNWCLHPAISGAASGYRMLAAVDDIVSDALREPRDLAVPKSLDPFIEELARRVLIPDLRAQLRAFYARHAIPSPVLDSYSGWRLLLHRIYREIMGKPVTYPSARELLGGGPRHHLARRLREESIDRWQQRRPGSSRIVAHVALVNPGPTYSPEGVMVRGPLGYTWEIGVFDTILYGPPRGPVLLFVPASEPEPRAAFLND